MVERKWDKATKYTRLYSFRMTKELTLRNHVVICSSVSYIVSGKTEDKLATLLARTAWQRAFNFLQKYFARRTQLSSTDLSFSVANWISVCIYFCRLLSLVRRSAAFVNKHFELKYLLWKRQFGACFMSFRSLWTLPIQ